MELDHVFMCVDDASAAEQALADFGLKFSVHAVHQGQGTANACAFFENAYLELLWRHDDHELQSEAVRPLALWERVRWRHTGASPFGLAFRPGRDEPPMDTWQYEAPFLPPGATLPIVTPRYAVDEPLIFLIPGTLPIRRRSPGQHRGRRRTVTGITVSGRRVSPLSSIVRERCSLATLSLRTAADHCLELQWDNGSAGESCDLRPTLPLVFRW